MEILSPTASVSKAKTTQIAGLFDLQSYTAKLSETLIPDMYADFVVVFSFLGNIQTNQV